MGIRTTLGSFACLAAGLLLTTSGVLAATGRPPQPAPRIMKLACAFDERKVENVLHYVARRRDCNAAGSTLVEFAAEFPAYACRTGRRGPLRLVEEPAACAPRRETEFTLPAAKRRVFCAARKGGALRSARTARDCARTERPVLLAKRPKGTTDAVVANPDTAGTDEDHSIKIRLLDNDRGPGKRRLSLESLDLSGTKGSITVVRDGVIGYDPNGRFGSLKPGQTATDTFRYTATNGARTSAPATVTVAIAGLNIAPALSGIESGPLGYFEGSAPVPLSASVAVADADDDNVRGANVIMRSGFDPAHDALGFSPSGGITSSYDSSTGALTLTGLATKADYERALRTVTFSTSGGAGGARTVSFQIEDDTAVSNVLDRHVIVDNAPDAVADSPAIAEDASATALNVLANDTDSDGGPKTIVSKTNGSHGAVAITDGGTGLAYTPVADYCGSDSFDYTLNGGSSATVTVAVTCVNDAPVNTSLPGPQTVDEDGSIPFTNAFSVADVDAAPSDVLETDLAVPNGTITVGAGGGTVTNNGTSSIRIDGTLSDINARLANVTYPPDTNLNGTRTLTMYTNDHGHTGTGGPLSDTDTVAITINAVNDAPVNTVPSGTQSTFLITPIVMTNAFSVADIDAGTGVVTVTLSAAHGSLAVDPTSAAVITGNATHSVPVTGTIAEVNGALDQVTYIADAGYDGADTITMTSNDQGHTGAGGAQIDTDTVSVFVTM